MTTQQPGQRLDDPVQSQQRKSQLARTRWLIAITALLVIAGGTIFWLVDRQSSLYAILPIVIFTVLSVIIGLFQWLFPVSSNVPDQPTFVIHPSILSQPTPPAPIEKAAHRGIAGLPLLTDARTIQQREHVVREVYAKLIQDDITAIALTGIGGAGKSTLAALIYRYTEEHRQTSNNPFLAETVWLTIDPAVTFADLAGNLFGVLERPLPDLGHLAPQNQAVILFNALNGIDQRRLIILDQFENLLDWDTGHALADRPGVGEWLDIINSQPCACRILLTSRPRPVGTREYPPTYLQEYPVGGLEISEGIALLQSRGVQGTDAELRSAVTHCAGHALSLTLLATLMRDYRLDLPTLFGNAALWSGDIATNLLDQIFTQKLNDAQCELLLTFSVYREPVPLEAAQAILTDASSTQVPPALKTLVTQHLVEAVGEGRYQLHAIVADYARGRFDVRSEQNSKESLRAAHAKAARYYLQRATVTCPPREKRRKVSDVHELIEAVWQYCRAEKWQEAYELMEQEWMFHDLRNWGGNAILLELCLLLQQQQTWVPETMQLANMYSSLAWAYSALGRRIWAREYNEQSLKLYQDRGDRRGESQAFMALGWSYLMTGQAKQALAYYEQALDICENLGDRKGEGFSRNSLGWIYSVLGQKRRALEYYRQALSTCREIEDRWGESRVLNSLGKIFIDLGFNEQALEYLEEALRIRRETGNYRGEGAVLNQMGRACRVLGQHELAVRYLERALNIGKEIGDRGMESLTLHHLGQVSISQKQYERAQGYLEQALFIRKELGDRHGEGRTLNGLGKAYYSLQKTEQARECYAQALDNANEIEDQWGKGTALLNFGRLYLERTCYDIALACFLLAERYFKELESPELHEALVQLHDLHQTVGDEKYSALLATVEPQAQQIVDQALHTGIRE